MHTIYFENRCITICQRADIPSGALEQQILSYSGPDSIRDLPERFAADTSLPDLYLVAADEAACYAAFCALFTEIQAGGGLVSNDRGEYLMIFRRGLWDLPKGKCEAGERIEECAVREVLEETGLSTVELGSLICVTHHTYHLDGIFCLKHTYWFQMKNRNGEPLRPQIEEEIHKAEWMPWSEVLAHAPLCYNSVKEVISRAGR